MNTDLVPRKSFDFDEFNDAGYLGLYGLSLSKIEESKNVEHGKLLKNLSGVELAANWFRITQTEAKLKRENIKDQQSANFAHYEVGRIIAESMEGLGYSSDKNLKINKKTPKKIN